MPQSWFDAPDKVADVSLSDLVTGRRPAPAKRSWFEDAFEAVKSIPDVARLLIEEPAATVSGFGEGALEGAKSVAPTAARTLTPLAGAAAGTLIPIPGVGTAVGAAAGGALGETIAEKLEGRDLNPRQIATQAALSAIPVPGGGKLAQIGKSAVLGGAGEVGTELAEGRTPTIGGVARGAVLGGAFGAIGSWFDKVAPGTAGKVDDVLPDSTPNLTATVPESVSAAAAPEIPATLMGTNTFAGPERRSATRMSQADWLAEQARKKQTEVQEGMQQGTLTLEDTIAKRPETAMKEAGEAARKAQAAAEGRPTGRASTDEPATTYDKRLAQARSMSREDFVAKYGKHPEDEIGSPLADVMEKGVPGVSVEPLQRPRLNDQPQIPSPHERAVVFRDENGTPRGILNLLTDTAGNPGVPVVWVDPAFRRQGVASRLYEEAEKAGFKLVESGDALTREGAELFHARANQARAVEPVTPVQEPNASIIGEPPVSVNTPAAREAAGVPARESRTTIEQRAKALGEPIPSQKPLDLARRKGEEVIIGKLPEPLQKGMKEVFDANNGFEAQRRGVQSNERTKALADHIQLEATKALPKGTALNAEELVAAGRHVATINDRINGLVEKINAGTATEWDMAALIAAREQQGVLAGNLLGARAEAGRSLQIMRSSIDFLESKDLIGLREAMKNPRFANDLEGFVKKWVTLDTDAAKLDFLRKSQVHSIGDKIRAMYFANILSGPKTHLRNVIGNTATQVFENASRLGALGYDVARSTVTNSPRTIFAGELAPRAVGAAVGVKQGLEDGLFTFLHGYTPKSLATFDVPRPELSGGLKNPFNIPGRLLEAEDQVFHAIAYNQELYSRLYAKARGQALKEGIDKDKIADYVQDRMSAWKLNTPKDVAQAAQAAAQRMVLKEDPGKWVQGLLNLKENGGKIGHFMNFIVPFIKTPANILRQGIEATPLGAIPGLRTSQQRAAFEAGGRESAEAAGRMIAGTSALGLLAYYAASGQISGSGPKDASERAALMEKGWRPQSIKIGDTWMDYTNIQPLSQPMMVMANAFDKYRETGKQPTPEEVAEIVAAAGGSLLDQSFLSGLSDTNAALNDPKRYGQQWVSRFAQGFVPGSGLGRNIAQAIDPVVREQKTIEGSIRSITPFASKTVDPKLSRFGEPVERPGGAFNRGFNPLTLSKESKDPLLEELARLKVESIGTPPTKLEDTKVSPGRDLTSAERQEMGVAVRAALETLFARPGFKDLDEDVARDLVGKAVSSARHQVVRRIRIAQAQNPR